MSNRRRPLNLKKLGRLTACPDCASEVRFAGSDRDGIPHLSIEHDDSCPWFRRYGGGQEFRTIALAPWEAVT